jgi:hypothetical protein
VRPYINKLGVVACAYDSNCEALGRQIAVRGWSRQKQETISEKYIKQKGYDLTGKVPA